MQKYYIYLGVNEKGKHLYKMLSDLSENDGRPFSQAKSGSGTSTYIQDKSLWKSKSIGQIFPITVKEEGSFSYNKDALPVGLWANIADRTEWRVKDSANDLLRKQKKSNIPGNDLRAAMEPIRKAYRSSSVEERTIILAEIINMITS